MHVLTPYCSGTMVLNPPFLLLLAVLATATAQTRAQNDLPKELTWHAASPSPRDDHLVPRGTAKRIHVLITADTSDPRVGDGVRIDLENLENAFEELVSDPQQLDLRTLDGANLTLDNIERKLLSFRFATSDTALFFFSGHGGYDDNGHFFNMANGDRLYRTDVIQAIHGTGVRLVGVVSNSCNTRSVSTGAHRTFQLPPARVKHVDGDGEIAPLLDSLFLKLYGVVDINGACEGETTQASAPRGSTSLRPFCDCLREYRDERIGWEVFVELLRGKILEEQEQRHGEGCPHRNNGELVAKHSAKVWSLPRENRGPRFGVTARDNGGHGARVAAIRDGLPATRCTDLTTERYFGLEPEDLILSVNGQTIHNSAHLVNAVMGSPQKMHFVVRDCRTGQVASMATMLRY